MNKGARHLVLWGTLGYLPIAAPAAEVWFEEVAAEAGLDFVHVRAVTPRLWFPEIMSGGGAWLDYDHDGDLDLYLVQGGEIDGDQRRGPPNRLFRNDGSSRFVDVTTRAGVGDRRYGMGAAIGDVDGDGHADIYVTNVGRNTLLRNRGDGSFEDVTATFGGGDESWSASAAFLDYDRDGDLDLFVANYVQWSPANEIDCFGAGGVRDYCHPLEYGAPAPDTLYRNDDGVLIDVSSESGLRDAFGNGLGVAVADLDQDGRIDIYVANDGTPNQLWRNQGDGTFRDRALLFGCAVNASGAAEAGMGVTVIDIDHDGDLDLFLTHLRQESNTFYLNRDGFFEDATPAIGLAGPSMQRTGFGTGFADFDHDGRLELYVANGRVGLGEIPFTPDDPFAEPDQLLRLDPAGVFSPLPPGSIESPQRVENSRAALFGDADGDGDVDLAIVNNGGPVRLLRNRSPTSGQWLRLVFDDEPWSLGARVRWSDGQTTRWRSVQRAYSYCASSEAAVHFGLGPDVATGQVLVAPIGGGALSFENVPVDRVLRIPARRR